ncbi:MAG: alpha/beta hydrolase [Myxococcaceae bacterium]
MRTMAGAVLLLACSACGVAYEQRTVSFDDRHGELGKMDVFSPKNVAKPAPGVLVLHGGSWTRGSKGDLDQQAQMLAAEGYVVANANYRLSPDTQFPGAVQDAWCALAWMRAHAAELKLSSEKVAVFGYSAGANLGDLVGLGAAQAGDCPNGQTSPVQAVISGDGPADMRTLPGLGAKEISDYLGGTPEQIPATYDASSPLKQVRSGAPPFLLIHGNTDLYVDVSQSYELRDALKGVGADAELLIIDGDAHTVNPSADLGDNDNVQYTVDSPEAWAVMRDFLGRTVGAPR